MHIMKRKGFIHIKQIVQNYLKIEVMAIIIQTIFIKTLKKNSI